MMFVEFYAKISDFVLIGQKRGSHKQLLNFTVRGKIRRYQRGNQIISRHFGFPFDKDFEIIWFFSI